MTRLIAAMTLLTFLAACGGLRDSKLNPRNWFGKSKQQTVTATTANVTDPRSLVAQVIAMKVDRVPDGAIVSAVGLPATQGYYQAELVPLNDGKPVKGTLKFEFRLLAPSTTHPTGAPRAREVLVGHAVSSQDLKGVRRIKVIAQQNSRTAKR